MAARMPPETYELWAKTIGKYVHQGFAPPGSRVAAGELNATTAAADEFGLAPRKFRHHVAKMIKQGYGIFWGIGVSAFPSGSPIVQAPAPEVSPVVKHDTDFWRKRATALGKELGAAQHTLEQLNGVRDIPYAIPEWLLDTKLHNRGRSVIGCLLSDIHMGEVISAEEIQGINEFNPEICKQRLEKYFKAACEVGERWSSDTDCDGVLLALAGDLTSGDIHEEHDECAYLARAGPGGRRDSGSWHQAPEGTVRTGACRSRPWQSRPDDDKADGQALRQALL
jgi:hypothetical protein